MEFTEFNHHSITTRYTIWQPPDDHLLNPGPTSSSSPPPAAVQIHIHFFTQTTHRFYNRPHHHDVETDDDRNPPPILIAVRRRPTYTTSICIPAHLIINSDSDSASHQIISRALTDLRILPSSFQVIMATDVVTWARNVMSLESNLGRVVIPGRVDIRTVGVHTRDEREWVLRGLRVSVEERERRGEGGMVAASEEAVRGLKSKTMAAAAEEGGESCRVCLEEFVEREEVTCMPCGHVFHTGCIETWLGTSHFCPICRFELPTADDH